MPARARCRSPSPRRCVAAARPGEIGIKVAGLAPMKRVCHACAVDEAVLKLTEFDSPAPEKYYFGKRRLGVELRDLYGRLIDTRQWRRRIAQRRRRLRQALGRRPADKSSRSWRCSRHRSIGRRRRREDPFRHPGFPGQLRLMAVAYSAASSARRAAR